MGQAKVKNRSSDSLLMGSLYQSVEEETGGQTRNSDDPPSDSHLITSIVCPFKEAHSSRVIRRRPLTCVFTSGQGAAEKERGSDLRGRWWKISPSTFQLRRQQAADGGPVSLCQPPPPELPATCWSQVLPGAPKGVPPAVVVRVKLGCETSTTMEM